MSHINDSQTSDSGKQYLVHWADTIVDKSLTRVVESGFVVDVDGEEWEAISCTDISRAEDCDDRCYVQWKDTWVPEWALDNARDAILEHEGLAIADAVLGLGEDVRSSIERTSYDQELSPPPSARRGRHRSSEIDLFHENQPDIPKLIFKPEFGMDYRPGLRELVERVIGGDSPLLQKWPETNDKRHLLFRELWVARASTFDMTRPERINAAFVQISGAEQKRPCECCERGNGPFIGCVVVANFANGACANCAIGWHSRKCNFHHNSKSNSAVIRLVLIIPSYRRSLATINEFFGLAIAVSRSSALAGNGRISNSTSHSAFPLSSLTPSYRRLARS